MALHSVPLHYTASREGLRGPDLLHDSLWNCAIPSWRRLKAVREVMLPSVTSQKRYG